MGMRIPLHNIKIMFESNPLKSIMLVGGLAVRRAVCTSRIATCALMKYLFRHGCTIEGYVRSNASSCR